MKSKLITMLALSAITQTAWSIHSSNESKDDDKFLEIKSSIESNFTGLSNAALDHDIDFSGVKSTHTIRNNKQILLDVVGDAIEDFDKALDGILFAQEQDSTDMPTNGGYENSCHCHCHNSRNWR